MSNQKFISVLGSLILLFAIYSTSFSQEVQNKNFFLNPMVISPTDTCLYKPGDVWRDNKINLQDIIELVGCVFRDCFSNPPCVKDVNGNGSENISDVIYLVNYLFRGGPAPVKSGVCCL
ncbi:MAG: hypothetical protein RBG1_1C00001G0337 [candidate division Zixibacteria bacterium RBG-1]|nr:MAG: hypothetical protein RBG1_1C00001G0337 [candidate division Zixibacteria bacterium RBG-1]OGC84474.1 MAG: hypothetical protein A2V73_02985 [candidate division Zixibacteria bacterium RBG_19FT_COMBO_42_43]